MDKVTDLIKAIVHIAKEVKYNSRQCKSLAEKLEYRQAALQRYKGRRVSHEELEVLNNFVVFVEDALALVHEHCDGDWLQKVWSRSTYRDRFEDINGRLDSYSQHLLLTASARYIPKEDEDEELDWQDIQEARVKAGLKPLVNGGDTADRRLQRQRADPNASVVTELDRSSISFGDSPEELGRGSCGRVLKGHWAGVDVAVKELHLCDWGEKVSNPGEKEFQWVADVGSRLHHPYIIHVYGAVTSGKPYLLVTELAPLGSLAQVMQQRMRENRCPPFSLPEALSILLQVGRAVAYLHSVGFAHCDLRPANLLCKANDVGGLEVKVADFGLARFAICFVSPDAALIGHRPYTAPEVSLNGYLRSDMKRADVYSFGVLAAEVLSGKAPYGSQSSMQTSAFHPCSKEWPELPSSIPRELPSLLKECCASHTKEQPTAERVVQRLQAIYQECIMSRSSNSGAAAAPVAAAGTSISEAMQ